MSFKRSRELRAVAVADARRCARPLYPQVSADRHEAAACAECDVWERGGLKTDQSAKVPVG
eukprot:6165786-Alexandrium_andersonii.AAC.1